MTGEKHIIQARYKRFLRTSRMTRSSVHGRGWDGAQTNGARTGQVQHFIGESTPMNEVDVRRRTLWVTVGISRQRSLSAGSDVKCGGGPEGTYVYIYIITMQGQSLTPDVVGNIYIIEAEGSVAKTCMIFTVKSGKQSHQVGSTFTARRSKGRNWGT